MSTVKYVLAAEADRIQDLLFRSSKLREVVGGSALVESFCREFKQQQQLSDEEVLVCAGGAFRFMFDSSEKCASISQQLVVRYFKQTGGTLSVARDYPEFDASDSGAFKAANHRAQIALRKAKANRGCTSIQSHLPIIGVCASCGTGLAKDFVGVVDVPDEPPNYRCGPCVSKDNLDRRLKFLRHFTQSVAMGKSCTFKPEEVGNFDERGYVAYLKADGNAFGELFDSCATPLQVKELSEGLATIMWESLVEPAKALFSMLDKQNQARIRQSLSYIPILPLIVAGDECLILLPAKWALDYCQRFCNAFEAGIQKLLQKINLPGKPTLSAAVVFCKASYPHKLAHRRLVTVLARTKREFRYHFYDETNPCSLVSFEVVKGSGVITDELSEAEDCLTSAQPYSTLKNGGMVQFLDLQQLIESRSSLEHLPNTRRNELRELFEIPPKRKDSSRSEWQSRLTQLLDRIKRMDASRPEDVGMFQRVEEVLYAQLGHSGDATREQSVWRLLVRGKDDQYVNGLGDLLEVWRFCESIEVGSATLAEALV